MVGCFFVAARGIFAPTKYRIKVGAFQTRRQIKGERREDKKKTGIC